MRAARHRHCWLSTPDKPFERFCKCGARQTWQAVEGTCGMAKFQKAKPCRK
jgi:hypothetical protein